MMYSYDCMHLSVQVVAGLVRTIQVQLVAAASESPSVNHVMEIITEANTLKLPISACILFYEIVSFYSIGISWFSAVSSGLCSDNPEKCTLVITDNYFP